MNDGYVEKNFRVIVTGLYLLITHYHNDSRGVRAGFGISGKVNQKVVPAPGELVTPISPR